MLCSQIVQRNVDSDGAQTQVKKKKKKDWELRKEQEKNYHSRINEIETKIRKSDKFHVEKG